MTPARSFDYDYLRNLVREHPAWTNRQLAQALTEHEREVRKDDTYPHITAHSVAAVKMRYRDAWREQGVIVPRSVTDPTRRNLPFRNVPDEYMHNYLMQGLRLLNKISNGDYVSVSKTREAEGLAKRLVKEVAVVDLTHKGEPYVRPARKDEVDGEGNLITFAAKYPGLSEEQWFALATPEARAAASSHYKA